ncbi:MAG: cupin domain-containing protein [Caldilineaceae bacterium]|nr:cupin domain-containing protein [Caldilineaceae bacterium]
MTTPYKYIESVARELADIPVESIVSRTLIAEPELRVVLFGFAAGQELTEHKTPMAATIQILAGEGEIKLGEDTTKVGPGDLIYMTPNLPHSVFAQSALTMILTMVKVSAK